MPFSEMPLRTSRWDAWSRPPWWIGRPSTRRTAVTSAVSRIGIASTSSGMMSVAIVDSATFQLVARPSEASVSPITWLPESPMKTAAGLRGRKLKGRKPATASASASETTSRRSSSWIQTASIGEEERGHDGEAPGEPVHVVEEVEGVRDRHEPEQAEGGGGDAVLDDLHADARREHDSGRGELPGELHGRRQGAEVVDQAEREDDRCAAGDAGELPGRLDRAGEQAGADACEQAEEDADAAERAACPARASGRRTGRRRSGRRGRCAAAPRSSGRRPGGRRLLRRRSWRKR